MNKRILFPSLAMLAITTFMVVGCSKDDDFNEFDTNLDINCNTHTTRSTGEDGWVGDSESLKRQYYRANTTYNKLQNACGITMLVDMWIREKPKSYFEVPPSECPKTAQQYADELLLAFGDNYDESTGIHPSEILNVANGGNPTGPYSCESFTSSDKSAFFADKNNQKKVCGIILTNTTTQNGHVAAVTYVGNTSISFSGFDIFNPDKKRWGIYSIPITGSKMVNKKDGSDGGAWVVTGVFLH